MATRLDSAYDAQVHRVRKKLVAASVAHWNGLGSWGDADFQRTLKALVPRIEAGQQEIANLTDAYIRRLAVAEFGSIGNGLPVAASTMALRGISAVTAFHRPFSSMYAALGDGKSFPDALDAGRSRLVDLVSSGSQLAKTHAARGAMRRSGFTKFQRVLTGRENCAMCVIASTQRYHRGDLLPIHPGCDCGVKPLVVDDGDDYQIINEPLLESTHAQIASKLGDSDRGARLLGVGKFAQSQLSDYTDLILAREHGELGPVLTWRTDKFTGSKEIN